ncbi:sensor histidine kinase [Subtercola endophyticus]|uniref:sensor histidine kinase n=1 Tax=Subtercola endophyticus TaxID=2895559 RepID=UPI001E56ADF6|nr:HAMP domain-containing sensor histidine kinase [Subtercola endophyticus]UFS57539.1 HAMP domain-containing histidine kinase [Subtercola endophyticus]
MTTSAEAAAAAAAAQPAGQSAALPAAQPARQPALHPIKRWLASLSGRITVVTTAVAVLAVLVTAAVAVPLIRASAVDQARTTLAQAADSFAATPVASLALAQRQQRLIGPSGTEVVEIAADGTTTGDGAKYISNALASRALSGQPVSDTVTVGATRVLVEARPTKSGGAVLLARSLDTVYAATGQVIWRLAIALLIGLVLAVLIGTALARWLARPLVAAAATARRLANRDSQAPDLRPAVARSPDLRSPDRQSPDPRSPGLGSAGPRSTVPRSSVTEVADVSDSLERLDQALKSSEARQREFLLSISHDIRSPLTALRGYGEALADGLIQPADVAAVGTTLVAETERLNRFVTDLLELARLEADDFRVDARPTDLGELVRTADAAWRARSAQAGLGLRLELPPASPLTSTLESPTASALTSPGTEAHIVTDPQRVRQIIDGLLDNAVRATPSGGSVIIALRVAEAVTIEVRDSGPGLSAADRAVAFDRGVLRDRYGDSRPVGSGLGLSIASRLAARLGGRLDVAEAPEGGAAFRLVLPRPAEQRAGADGGHRG